MPAKICGARFLLLLLGALALVAAVVSCTSGTSPGPATMPDSTLRPGTASSAPALPSSSAPSNPGGGVTTSGRVTVPAETTGEYLAQLDLTKIMNDGADYASVAARDQTDAQATVQTLLAKYRDVDRSQVLRTVFDRLTAGAKTETDKEKAVLYFVQKLSIHDFGSPFMGLPIFDPLILFVVHAMDCQKCSRLIADLYASAGYQSRLVDLYGHMVAEVRYESSWHYADADFFGGGQVVTMPDGHIPSMAELSRDYRLLDGLQPYLEMNVLFSYGVTGKGPSYWTYPSYSYFSTAYFAKNPGYPYYLYKNAAPAPAADPTGQDAMMFGWNESRGEVRRDKATDIKLSDIPETATPNVPQITGVQIQGNSVVLWFSDTDPIGTISGYTVFVATTSRGWDYGSFGGGAAPRQFWANAGGWTSSMYDRLFTLPPHDIREMETKTGSATVSGLGRGRYFISVMARDAYGDSVGKKVYPLSNEIVVDIG